jgi:hypothetical protein
MSNNDKNKRNDDGGHVHNFDEHVFPAELSDIKQRRIINKDGVTITRGDHEHLALDDFLDSDEERTSVFNNVIEELYNPQNDAAWDDWLLQKDGKKDDIQKGLTGLAFSGGGIRSATFNLGVLQALNTIGLFRCVDYLSTVSGGGYIGACVSSLYASRATEEKKSTEDTDFPFKHQQGQRESAVFRYLRNHANYLAPDGFISGLRIPAILLRGIIINFLVIIPYILMLAVFTVWLMPTVYHIEGSKAILLPDAIDPGGHFLVTKILLFSFVLMLALFPLIFKLLRATKGQNNLANWSVREKIAKLMGGAIIVLAVSAFIELQPIAIQFIHDLETEGFKALNFGLSAGAGSTVAAMFANHLLPKISKYSGKITIYAIGALGFLTFWILYLSLCHSAIDWDVASGSEDVLDAFLIGPFLFAITLITLVHQVLKHKITLVHTYIRIFTTGVLALALIVTMIIQNLTHESTIDALSKITALDTYVIIASFLGLYTMFFVDVNLTSIHRFYRDKLSRAYIFGYNNDETSAAAKPLLHTDHVKLSALDTAHAPYHLINTLLNLNKTTESHKNGRRGDFFIFTKNHIGGEITGYCETLTMEKASSHINVATAMAISGAAAAPNAGAVTIKPLIFIMAMLNIRLNYWLLNPAKVATDNHKRYNSGFNRVGPAYLFHELMGGTNADHNFVNLSDGGHIENLGVYELLRRECRLIIAGDGEADGGLTFQGLAKLIQMAQIDMGIKIVIDGLDEIRRGEQHHAVGTIYYSDKRIGKMIYLKSSLLGDSNLKATLDKEEYTTSPYRDDNLMFDDNAYIAYYKSKNPDFPHQSTADQFFDESQFECYRALGYRVGMVTFCS